MNESDDEIYKKLGLIPIPPEIREDSGEIESALSGKLPEPTPQGNNEPLDSSYGK